MYKNYKTKNFQMNWFLKKIHFFHKRINIWRIFLSNYIVSVSDYYALPGWKDYQYNFKIALISTGTTVSVNAR